MHCLPFGLHRLTVCVGRDYTSVDLTWKNHPESIPSNIYAQIIAETGDKVLASASTVEADVRKKVKNGGNVEAAAAIGKLIAEKAKKAGITTVAFDRSGYKYHGRIKALADAARENGLSF